MTEKKWTTAETVADLLRNVADNGYAFTLEGLTPLEIAEEMVEYSGIEIPLPELEAEIARQRPSAPKGV